MHEIHHPRIYRWTEYALEQKRMAEERRHAWAAFLGTLTALLFAAGLLYMAG